MSFYFFYHTSLVFYFIKYSGQGTYTVKTPVSGLPASGPEKVWFVCSWELDQVSAFESCPPTGSDCTLLRVFILQVFKGNTYEDPFSRKINRLTEDHLLASSIRIWPVHSNASCTRLKLYGEPIKCKL